MCPVIRVIVCERRNRKAERQLKINKKRKSGGGWGPWLVPGWQWSLSTLWAEAGAWTLRL